MVQHFRPGVPQGSILGPRLILLHYNSVVFSLSVSTERFCRYADDTSVSVVEDSVRGISLRIGNGVKQIL